MHQRPTRNGEACFLEVCQEALHYDQLPITLGMWTLAEQVAIFLYTMVTNLSNRKVGERFQRSGLLSQSINFHSHFLAMAHVCLFIRCFNQIWMLSHPQLSTRLCEIPNPIYPLAPYIANNARNIPILQKVHLEHWMALILFLHYGNIGARGVDWVGSFQHRFFM